MSRVQVWYDDVCNQIFISGEQHSFAPRSLVCTINGGGTTILIAPRGSPTAYIAGGRYYDFGQEDGTPFDTPENTKTYLDSVFDRWPYAGLAPQAYTAGEPISGQRVVRLAGTDTVRAAASNDISQVGLILGVSTEAADIGSPVKVTTIGPIESDTFNFNPGPVFLGLNGALIQVPPASGFIQQMGTATSSTRLLVERGAPIILAQ